MTFSELQGGKGLPPLTIDPNILSGGPHRYSWQLLKNFWKFFWNFSKIFFQVFNFISSKFWVFLKNDFWKFHTKSINKFFWSKISKKHFFSFFVRIPWGPSQKIFRHSSAIESRIYLWNMTDNFIDFELMLSSLGLFT